jgi:transketolase
MDQKTTFNWPKEPCDSEVARKAIRQTILEQIYLAKSGHPGGSLSLVEILSAIFSENFEHTPQNPERPDRDRLVLSKGHGVPALYSFLSYLGYFQPKELRGLRQLGHFLQGHPDKNKFPLMETSTGSLGQGASVALGLALGLRLSFLNKEIPRLPKVYAVLGDGEIQEGQIWECLMAAGKFKPGNLIFILDRNRGQIDGPVDEIMDLDPLDEKIRSFRWNVHSIDGHNVEEFKKKLSSLEITPNGRPHFIIANTVKGKGISFMEHPTAWHGVAPKKEELDKALNELFDNTDGKRPFGALV